MLLFAWYGLVAEVSRQFFLRDPTTGGPGRRRVLLEVVGCCSACSSYCFIVRMGSGDALRLGINIAAGK